MYENYAAVCFALAAKGLGFMRSDFEPGTAAVLCSSARYIYFQFNLLNTQDTVFSVPT